VYRRPRRSPPHPGMGCNVALFISIKVGTDTLHASGVRSGTISVNYTHCPPGEGQPRATPWVANIDSIRSAEGATNRSPGQRPGLLTSIRSRSAEGATYHCAVNSIFISQVAPSALARLCPGVSPGRCPGL
jgi:hypothetical protein